MTRREWTAEEMELARKGARLHPWYSKDERYLEDKVIFRNDETVEMLIFRAQGGVDWGAWTVPVVVSDKCPADVIYLVGWREDEDGEQKLDAVAITNVGLRAV